MLWNFSLQADLLFSLSPLLSLSTVYISVPDCSSKCWLNSLSHRDQVIYVFHSCYFKPECLCRNNLLFKCGLVFWNEEFISCGDWCTLLSPEILASSSPENSLFPNDITLWANAQYIFSNNLLMCIMLKIWYTNYL